MGKVYKDGSHSDVLMARKLKNHSEKIEKIPPTTVRLLRLDVVRIYTLNNKETLNAYVNRLIKEDILRNAPEDIVKKYFKKES